MRIGFTELLVIFVVALLVLGPDQLPRYAGKLGAALASFRKATEEATEEIRKNVVEPLDEAQRPLRQAMEPVEDLRQSVEKDLRSVGKSVRDIGKTEKKASQDRKTPEEAEHENRNERTAGGAVDRADRIRPDPDPQADTDVRQERQEL